MRKWYKYLPNISHEKYFPIISIAEKAGFKFQSLKCCDYVTKIKRSVLISKLIPDRIIKIFGRFNPYVRIFNFVKNV